MLWFVILSSFASLINANELVSVVAVTRHGDRNPLYPTYPNDPYKNESHWPEGFNQLTYRGIQRQHDFGVWLRNRYNNFLPSSYSPESIRVTSTDVERTIMSALATLTGLYPPTGEEKLDSRLKWLQIPIHTKPQIKDAVFAMKKPCPQYNKLFSDLLKSDKIVKIDEDNHELYRFLSEKTGSRIKTLLDMEIIYNVLITQKLANKTLPEWANEELLKKLKPLAAFRYKIDCCTLQLVRLKVGLWFNEIVTHFRGFAENMENPKFLLYSGHDTTLARILTTLGSYDDDIPPYSSAIIMELSRDGQDKYYLDIFYKKGDELRNLTAENSCRKFDDFVDFIKPITLNIDEWEKECEITN